MFWYGNHMGAWGYVLMTLSMIIFWGLLIAGIVALVRYAVRGGQPTPPAQVTPTEATPRPATPEQVLGDRFARGEIDADEYHHRLDTLRAAASRSQRSSPDTS